MPAYIWADGQLFTLEDGVKVELAGNDVVIVSKQNDDAIAYVKLSDHSSFVVVGKEPKATQPEQG